jgi:hypothetical protein
MIIQTKVVGWHDLNEVVKLWEKIKEEMRQIIKSESDRRNISSGYITYEEILSWSTEIVCKHEGPQIWSDTLADTIMGELTK